MKRRQFMAGLAASPTVLLAAEPKEEAFVWKPPIEIIRQTRCSIKAGELLPEDRLRGAEGFDYYWLEFPEGKWQLAEIKYIKVQDD